MAFAQRSIRWFVAFLVVALVGALSIPATSSAQAGAGDDVVLSPAEGFETAALDADGNLVLARVADSQIELVRCTDETCSDTPQPLSVDAQSVKDLAIDSDGNPVIAYSNDRANNDVGLVRCANATCRMHRPPTMIDLPSDRESSFVTLVLDNENKPVLLTMLKGGVRLLHCTTSTCSDEPNWKRIQRGSWAIGSTPLALAVNADNHPVVAVPSSQGVDVITCMNPRCSGDKTVVALTLPGRLTGAATSITLDDSGRPAISVNPLYVGDRNNQLYVIRCTTVDCSGKQQPVAVNRTARATFSSIALDDDDNPVISYTELTPQVGGYSVLHCTNPQCSGPQEPAVVSTQRSANTSELFLHANGDVVAVWPGDVAHRCVGSCDGVEVVPAECGSMVDANLILGTDGRDVLVGTPGPDIIIGLRGGDRISGKAGDDCILAGTGADRVSGGRGNDILVGDKGNDILRGGAGTDTTTGGTGDDRCSDASTTCEGQTRRR